MMTDGTPRTNGTTVSIDANPLPGLPLVEHPLFEQLLPQMGLDDEERRIACDLNEKGFAVLDFPDDDFDAMAERLKTSLVETPQFSDIKDIGPDNPAKAIRRIQDGVSNADVRAIAGNGRIIEILSKIYGRPAFPFQTLNFAVGTQQPAHSDAVHFSSVPERFMAGVWVALEDVGPDQGPLVYYPGSHKWPVIHTDEVGNSLARPKGHGQLVFAAAWQAYVDAYGVAPEHFQAKKGQALIWAANLLHGGSTQTDRTKTRWSQVTHYYFDDCAYTTPMHSNPRLGAICFRDNIRDLRSGARKPNRYLGEPIRRENLYVLRAKAFGQRAANRIKRALGLT